MWKFIAATVVMFVPLAFFYSNCSKSGSAGAPAVAQGFSSTAGEKVVGLRDGYNGYAGTKDTTIYVSNTDWSNYLIPGSAGTAQQAASGVDVFQANASRSFGLLQFDVTGVANDLLRAGDTCAANIEVVKAELELFGVVGGASAFVSVTPMKHTAPAWSEADATYTNADSSTPWPASANPSQPVLDSAQLGYFDAMDGSANSLINRHLTFSIPTDAVKEWLCDSNKNRGLLWRFHSGSNNKATFFTREFPERTFRPLLTLWLRRLP